VNAKSPRPKRNSTIYNEKKIINAEMDYVVILMVKAVNSDSIQQTNRPAHSITGRKVIAGTPNEKTCSKKLITSRTQKNHPWLLKNHIP
jgi:hypothetical protein